MTTYAQIKKLYIVDVNIGEEKSIDLPPMNPGPIEIRLLTTPGNPHTHPPTLPQGPGTHVLIGLNHDGIGKLFPPQLPLHNLTATATKPDALWKLKIKNTDTDPDGAKRFQALVLYPGPNPILTRTIPLSFFQRAFDEFWNNYRPIENIQVNYEFDEDIDKTVNMIGINVQIPTTKLILTLKQEIVELYNGELSDLAKLYDGKLKGNILKIPIPLVIDVPHMDDDINVRLHDINITNIRFSMLSDTTYPTISINTTIESSGPSEMSAHWNPGGVNDFDKSINFTNIQFRMQIALTLVTPIESPDNIIGEKNLFFKAKSEFNVTPNFFIDYGFGTYDISTPAEAKINNFINQKIEIFLNNQITRVAGFLLGEHYPVLDLKCVNNNIIIKYVGSPAFEDFSPSINKGTKFTPPANLAKIDHIVVLMMENRSFDHMVGYLKLEEGRTDIDGLSGNEFNLDPNGKKISINHLTNTQIDESPCHDTMCVTEQLGGRTMNGFVTNFARRYADRQNKWNEVMGYYNKHEVPTFDYLSKEFTILDKWFCSHPGPTLPNRIVAYTGKLDTDNIGNVIYDNYDFSKFTTIETPTIFEYLTRYGVTWKVFEHGYSFIRAFTRHSFDTTNVLPVENATTGFYALAKQGKLPSVSFIEPDYIDVPPGNDDHPPADIANGQSFISRVIRALQDSPQWGKTLLIITYDEHGGFYDHVVPPLNVPSIGWGITYGPRVPSFAISPWVPTRSVSHEVFDHTSILTTIRRRFLPPNVTVNLGARVTDKANDLGLLLSLTKPRKTINKIPVLEYHGTPNTFKMMPPSLKQNDFHEALFGLRILLGYPPK